MTEDRLFDFDDTAPVRATDPEPSKVAAQRAGYVVRGQAFEALRVIGRYAGEGASTRQIQAILYNPADPAWNKVATRCLSLQRKGLAARRRVTNELGETVAATRKDATRQPFLVYWITDKGRQALEAAK